MVGKKIVFGGLLVLIAAFFGINTQTVNALSEDYLNSDCYASETSYYDARDTIKPGDYDIYVKLGRRGQSAPVKLVIENDQLTTCDNIGSVDANGETWTNIGNWKPSDQEVVRFQLSSPEFSQQPDANRPSVLLLPHNSPPCQLTQECTLTFDGQSAYIVPQSSVLSENDLRVLQVHNPDSDKLVQVDYYSDGQLLYTTKNLETFNLRYVPGGQHNLKRVLVYESGQKVVLPSQVTVSFASDFQNLLFRQLHNNQIAIIVVITLLVITVIGAIALGIIHALHRRKVWKLTHGLNNKPEQTAEFVTPSDVQPLPFAPEVSPAKKYAKLFVPIISIIVATLFMIVFIDSYVAKLFKVDGPSMENTLQTDDLLFVNLLPKSWANLNRQEFVPKRGQVIIFYKQHSELFLEENTDEAKTYVVKRVIGLPGERVVARNGQYTVFNSEHPEGFNPDAGSSWENKVIIENTEDIDVTLGPSEIFVSGDNRPESLDSRINGPIDVQSIIGVVESRVLPVGKINQL